MSKRPTIVLVSSMCFHYRLPVFEMLSKKYPVNFIFTREVKEFTQDEYGFCWNNYGSINHAVCRSTWGLAFKLLKDPYDVLITKFPTWNSLLEFLISKLRRRKLIFWSGEWHQPETLTRRIVTPALKFMAKRCHAIVVYGSPQRAHMLGYGAKQDKIFLAPNTSLVDTQGEVRRNQDIESEIKGKKVILYLARLVRYKGGDCLIRAFSKIEQERNDITLLIGGDGDFRGELERLCRQLSLRNVKFVGAVALQDRAYYYQMCNVFVLPSIWQPDYCEAWGLTLNEAMQFGKPVIATDAVGAALDLIKDGINGFVVKNGDVDGLYQAMERIISEPELERRMGLESKRIIEEGFTYEHMVKGFGEAIAFVLGELE